MSLVLYQFAASHFNEKARWALDLKRLPHERISLLPGPHAPKIKKLSGQTQTPVLVDDGEVVAGSAPIIEHLERRFPQPALYPGDPEQRLRALHIQREFDTAVGPAVRLAKFFDVLDAGYVSGTFGRDASPLARGIYRAAFPLIGRVMKRSMAITAANAEQARARTHQAFDFVVSATERSGYLVGPDFSVADLACAALLMPAVAVSEWGGPAEATTEKSRAWLARWADHPGAEWVRQIYRRHRRPNDISNVRSPQLTQ